MNQSPQSIEKQFAAQTGESLNNLPNVEVPAVQEMIGEVAGQQIQASQNDKKKSAAFFDFGNISNKISGLVSNYTTQRSNKALPPVKSQAKIVEKTLKKEQGKLIKKANKLKKSRRFSAHELEKILLEVRRLQKIIEELLHAATERISELYQQYILKKA